MGNRGGTGVARREGTIRPAPQSQALSIHSHWYRARNRHPLHPRFQQRTHRPKPHHLLRKPPNHRLHLLPRIEPPQPKPNRRVHRIIRHPDRHKHMRGGQVRRVAGGSRTDGNVPQGHQQRVALDIRNGNIQVVGQAVFCSGQASEQCQRASDFYHLNTPLGKPPSTA